MSYFIIVDGKLEKTFSDIDRKLAEEYAAEFYSLDKDEPDVVLQIIKGEELEFNAKIKVTFIEIEDD